MVSEVTNHIFSDLSSEWWNPNGAFKTLHDINPTRLEWIKSHVNLSGQKVLDVGCGGGILSEALALEGADVLGVDLSENLIQVATNHSPPNIKLHYQHTTLEHLNFQESGLFDIITCLEMLEHVDSPQDIIQQCVKFLKPGGMLFLSTLNRNLKSFTLGVLLAEYVFGFVPRGTHQYERFIQPHELCHMCRESGLEVKELTGLNYNPLTRQAKLCHDLKINYLCLAIKGTEHEHTEESPSIWKGV